MPGKESEAGKLVRFMARRYGEARARFREATPGTEESKRAAELLVEANRDREKALTLHERSVSGKYRTKEENSAINKEVRRLSRYWRSRINR
jgi:hypothetical protein